MTRPWLLGAVLAATLLTPAAAQAASQTITVGTGNQRVVCTTNCATVVPGTAANVTINRNEIVTWTYAPTSSQKHHIQSIDQTVGDPEVWDFLPGVDPTSGSFPHTFHTLGTFAYHCQLHPSDMFGTVTVLNNLPTAGLTAPTTAPANGAGLTLDASLSADSDGTIADYSWDLDGDGTFETDGNTTPTITHAFTTTGLVTVGVRVTDNDGGSAIAQLPLNVAAPVQTTPPTDPGAGTPPASQPPATTPSGGGAAPAPISAPLAVPVALAAASSAGPTASAPAGQHLKSQRGVKIRVTCPAACQLVLSGNAKVGAKRLRLTSLKRSLAAGATATITLKVDSRDLKALRKARGKAKVAVKVAATSGGTATSLSVPASIAT